MANPWANMKEYPPEVWEEALRHKGLVYITLHKPYAKQLLASTDLEEEDLLSVGLVAICKALGSYDPDRGAWSTWAVRCIFSAFGQVRKGMETQVKPGTVSSLDARLVASEDGGERSDLLPAVEGHEDTTVVRVYLQEALAKVENPRAREVVRLHYLEDVSLAEISRRTGLSAPRVSQLHMKGLKGLRQAMALEPKAKAVGDRRDRKTGPKPPCGQCGAEARSYSAELCGKCYQRAQAQRRRAA